LAGISFVNWQKIGISGLAFFDEHAVEHRDNRHSYKTARAESAPPLSQPTGRTRGIRSRERWRRN
jgi:hypothetical protein